MKICVSTIVLGILLMGASLIFYIEPARAAEPDLITILNSLGFTDIEESSVEGFIPGTYEVSLYAEFCDYHNSNELSWYPVETSQYNLIFSGAEGNRDYVDPPLSKSYTINAKFGLSFLSPEGRYFTETDRNPDGIKHAQIYVNRDTPDMFLIGFENHLGGGDKDYNDMVISLELTPTTVPIDGVNWYIFNATSDKAMIYLDGGWVASTTSVGVFSYHEDIKTNESLFIKNMVWNGFDTLTNKDRILYDGSQTFVEDAATWLLNEGYEHVFLFGYSAGGVVIGYEIQKDYASMFSAAVLASAPVNCRSGIYRSAQTADKDKVATCFIEGVTDAYYDQMLLYYNNALIHKKWYDWTNDHDIFPHVSKDTGEDVPTVTIDWYNAAHPPSTPLTPSGRTWGYTDVSYSYSTMTVDANDDDVYYLFDWDDDSTTLIGPYSSGATVSASHMWSSTGTYNVKVKAKDSHEAWSVWSPYLAVSIRMSGGGCPYVSAWNGEEYVVDNNLLPTAEANSGSDVEDWYMLEQPLLPIRQNPQFSLYSLQIREFEQEHSYLDQTTLIAVDHDQDVNIAVTPTGEILTYREPQPPISCVDADGQNRLSEILEVDGDVSDPVTYFYGETGDYLVLNFGEVESEDAKLILRDDMKCMICCIEVQVLDADGEWQTVSVVAPREYWATEAVNLSEYTPKDEDFLVRLYWTSPHRLDYVGLDLSAQEDVELHQAMLVTALHSVEGNVKSLLKENDQNYAELDPGEQITLTFKLANNQQEQRTFILYTEGSYYTIT